jgi:hypothetical protein
VVLPNAKELQGIVDYSRIPAIDPIFDLHEDESWFWTSTTHLDSLSADNAVYVAFGRAYGVAPDGRLYDVHGAGAQRSDPKSDNPANYSEGRGSSGQDDQVRIYNYARCVRDGASAEVLTGGEALTNQSAEQSPSDLGQGGQGGQRGGPPRIDFTSAAAELGVTEQALREALGDPSQGRPDFAATAQQLGITESELVAALGIPEGILPPAAPTQMNKP